MLGITEEKLDKKNNNSDDTEQIELDTKFYGRIKISKKQKLIFTQGLYGFENLKEYYIIDFNGGPFYWLQSGENPDIAFVVIEPTTFMKDYRLEINPSDFEEIGLKTKQEIKDYLKVLVIITIPENPEKMTANLIGPIIINKRDGIAMQALALNNDYTTKHLVLEELEKLQGRETWLMLVLARKPNQSIMIGDDIEIRIVDVRGDQVKIGIEAPRNIAVHRKEIYEEIQAANIEASSKTSVSEDSIKVINDVSKIIIKKKAKPENSNKNQSNSKKSDSNK